MIIANSNVGMYSRRTHAQYEATQSACAISLAGEQGLMEAGRGDFLFMNHRQEEQEGKTGEAFLRGESSQPRDESILAKTSTSSPAMDAYLSLKKPGSSDQEIKTIRSFEELRMLLLQQMIDSIQNRSWKRMHGPRQDMPSNWKMAQQVSAKANESQENQTQIALSGEYTVSRNNSHYYAEQEVTSFHSMGHVTTADGRNMDFAIDFEMSRSFLSYEESTEQTTFRLCDPLVINYAGNVAELTDQTFFFDLNADGSKEELHQLAPGSGFLSLDRNGDGKINDGTELFGTRSGQGFDDLAAYDSDGNGWIDEADEVFSRLRVWTKNADGTDSLLSLKEVGVGAIYLDSARTQFSLTNLETNSMEAMLERSGIFLYEEGGVGTIQHMNYAI